MNDQQSLQASLWLMVAIQTIGSVDMPGSGERKMPSPHQYVAIVVAWSALELATDAGWGRPASVVGWVMVLTGMVLGPFGQRATNFLKTIAQQFAIAPPPTTTQPGQTSSASQLV